MRKSKLTCSLLFIFALFFTCACKTSWTGEKPSKVQPPAQAAEKVNAPRTSPVDVFIIAMDSTRWDHLETYGYKVPTSPGLAALAKQSIVFTRAYTTAPWTLPAFATLMTGHHPYAVGIRREDNGMTSGVLTLPQLFNKNGYQTAGVISHIYLEKKYGVTTDFEFLDTRISQQPITSPHVTNTALKYLEQNKDKPLFMLLHYFDPHYSYIMHDILNTYPDYKGRLCSDMDLFELRDMASTMNKDDHRYLNALYDSEIRFTDSHVDRFLTGLKKAGKYDDALIVFLADHGEELGNRPPLYWVGHTKTVTEETIRVPLFIKLPGSSSSRTIHQPISTVDLMPTIARLAGIDIPKNSGIWGRALDLNKPENNRRTVFSETGRFDNYQTAIKGNWKLVAHGRNEHATYQLHDLSKDVWEHKDLSNEETGKLSELKAELAEWKRKLEEQKKKIVPKEAKPDLSKEEKERLRSLGYIK